MITGANTNVRYRGTVFHVQTEDSGRSNPHIISHVYSGGTILASEKTDYSDRVGAEDLEDQVRGLIEQQHKAMLQRLKGGEFDVTIAERLGDSAPSAPALPADAPTPMPEAEEQPPSRAKPPAVAKPANEPLEPRAFGDGIVSDKPLDELILDYLADKARQRAAAGGAKARKSS